MSDYSETLKLLNSLDSGTSSLSGVTGVMEGIGIWTIIAAIIAIVGGILIYFLFVKAKNSPKGFAGWLKDFLSFKILWIKPVLKIAYYIATIFAVLFSFSWLGMLGIMGGLAFLYFLLYLIVIPIAMRIAYEAALMFVGIWQNTKDIAEGKKK